MNVRAAEAEKRSSGSPASGGQASGGPATGGPTTGGRSTARYVIAVMSGKGGVGKSLVSALLAVNLRRMGFTVGLLDADIGGPSIPRMFLPGGVEGGPDIDSQRPAVSGAGIKLMSINLRLESEDQPVVWRGYLVAKAIRQLWLDVDWGYLDYLVIDMPPGTSDAALTVLQGMPNSGVLLVTSPQDLAGMVVRKAASMAAMLDVPILGLIENMSYFQAPDTGTKYEVFGPSHAQATASRFGMPFLGRLPIDPQLVTLTDTGRIEQCGPDAFNGIAGRLLQLTPVARPAAASDPGLATEWDTPFDTY